MWSEGVQWVWAGSSEAPFHKSPQPAVIGLHIPPRITTHPLFVFRKKILKHLLWLPELLTVMCQNKLRFHFTSHWMQLLKWWFFSLVRFLQHLLLQAATFPFLPASVFMIYLQLSSPITRWNKHLQNTSFGLVLAALLCMKCVISWENNRSGTFFSLFAKWSGHFWKRAALRKQDGTFRVPSEMAQCFVPNETARSFDRFDCPLIKTGEVAWARHMESARPHSCAARATPGACLSVTSATVCMELLHFPRAMICEWTWTLYSPGVPPAGASRPLWPILTQWLSARPRRSRGAVRVADQRTARWRWMVASLRRCAPLAPQMWLHWTAALLLLLCHIMDLWQVWLDCHLSYVLVLVLTRASVNVRKVGGRANVKFCKYFASKYSGSWMLTSRF